MPVVRTFITVVAGVGRMDRRRFFTWSLVGAVLWATGITLLGYFLGQAFPVLQDKLELAVLAIVAVSLVPALVEYLRHRRRVHAMADETVDAVEDIARRPLTPPAGPHGSRPSLPVRVRSTPRSDQHSATTTSSASPPLSTNVPRGPSTPPDHTAEAQREHRAGAGDAAHRGEHPAPLRLGGPQHVERAQRGVDRPVDTPGTTSTAARNATVGDIPARTIAPAVPARPAAGAAPAPGRCHAPLPRPLASQPRGARAHAAVDHRLYWTWRLPWAQTVSAVTGTRSSLVETLESPEQTEIAWETLCQQFRHLAEIGRQKGISALYNEQMYIPSEIPWTLEQAERFLRDTRTPHGRPVRLTLDVGHQAGMHYGLSGSDLDYLEWIRRFGAGTELIHVQQTTPDASHHWPFTPTYNERGHIRLEAVLDALRASHRAAAEAPSARPCPRSTAPTWSPRSSPARPKPRRRCWPS